MQYFNVYDNYIRCIDLNNNKIDVKNLLMKMCKNLKILNNMFKDKKISEKENFILKILLTVFNSEIPKEWENKNNNNNENYFDNNFDSNNNNENKNKINENKKYNNNINNERLISKNNELKTQNALLKKEIIYLKN